MKLGLTDKQYNLLLTVLKEQGETPAAEPEKGTSDKQSGGQGYPSVGKWESGVTRGPGNQVGVTKWADVVGSKLTRGKGNQLKEQEEPLLFDKGDQLRKEKDEKTKKEEQEFFKKFVNYPTPLGYNKLNQITLPRSVGENKTKIVLFGDDGNKKVYDFFKIYLTDSRYKQYDWVIPTPKYLNELLPSGTISKFNVNNIWYFPILKRVSDNPLYYKFNGYYTKDNNYPYKLDMFLNEKDIPESLREKTGFWNEWGNMILVSAGLIISFWVPGSIGLWVGLGIDSVAVINSILLEDSVGAILGIVCAFLPFIGMGLKIGEVSVSQARRITGALKYCKTEEELANLINGVSKTPGGRLLTNQDRYVLQKLKDIDPKEIGKLMEGSILEKINILKKQNTIVSKQELQKIYENVNELYNKGIIDKVKADKFYKRFGFETLSFVVGSIFGIGFISEILKGLKQYYMIKNKDFSGDPNYVKFINLQETFLQLDRDLVGEKRQKYEQQIEPIHKKYQELCKSTFSDNEFDIRLLSICIDVMRKYNENENVNLDNVAYQQFIIEKKEYEKNK